MKSIITISREYGSGGRFIAQKLAQKLGVPYFDNNLITLAAKESGYAEGIFEKAEQISTHSLLYSLSMFGSSTGVYGLPLSDKVYIIQSDIIKKCASDGPCVIVGRCSDYVLRDYDNVINFFLYSDMEHKIKRCVEFYDVEEAKAKSVIDQKNKKRAAYYNYYTSQRWGEMSNYDLSLNTDMVGIDGCVDLLFDFVVKHENKQ